MYDGSLKFDTSINQDGFEEGVASLKDVAERLITSIETLAGKITESFTAAGSAAASAAADVDRITESAENAKDKAGQLEEQMAAIEVTGLDPESPEPESSEDISSVYERGSAAMRDYGTEVQDFIAQYGAGTEEAQGKTNEFIEELTRLGSELESLQGAGMYFGDDEFDEAYLKLEKVKQAIADYKKELLNPAETKEQKTPFASDSLQGTIERLKSELRGLEQQGIGFGDKLYDETYQALKAAEAELADYKRQLMAIDDGDSAEEAANSVRKIPDAVEQAFSRASKTVENFAKTLGGKIKGGAEKAIRHLKGLKKPAEGASKSILKLSNMFKMMVLRMAMRAVIQGVKEGFQNLVQYSDSANQAISGLSSSSTYLKNSFAAAFAPILSIVAPTLNTLISLLATAINYINQFFSALGGSTTFVKAKKVNEDYAKSLSGVGSAASGAGKEAKKALAPFDDLIQVSQQADASGGGGGGIDPSSMFETVAIESSVADFARKLKDMFAAGDYEGIGRILGEKINAAVARISNFINWDNCGEQITKFINGFTAIFNSLVATIDWDAIGAMFGLGINTLAHIIYLLFTGIDWHLLGTALSDGLNGLVHTVDWELFGNAIGATLQAKIAFLAAFALNADWPAIGAAIATGLMGVTAMINWEELGLLFARGLNGIFTVMRNFAGTFDWTGFGSSLALSLSTFFRNFDWAGAGTAISDIVIGILNTLTTFVKETDWRAFGQGVADGIRAIDWSGIVSGLFEFIGACFGGFAAFLGGLLADGATAARDYFQGKIEECGGNIVLGILKGIWDGLVGIAGWIFDNVFTPFMDGFKAAFGIHSPSTAMAEMGKYLWDGFCNGIREFFADPTAFIKANITDPFVNKIKNLLGIHSPSTVLQGIGGNTVEGFNKGITDKRSASQSVVQSWATGVMGWFSSKLGISTGNSAESQKWASATMDGYNTTVSSKYTGSQGVMERWAENVRKWFVASGEGQGVNEASWTKFADQVIQAFKTKIEGSHTDTQSVMELWAENVRIWFIGPGEAQGVNEVSWTKFADQIIQAFKTKIENAYTETRSGMETWARNAREWFWGDSNPGGTGGMYAAFYDMGKRINEGFAKGISDFAHLAKAAIRKWAQEAMDEAREEFDINSPSKKFRTIAEYVVQGFNAGILDMIDTSLDAAGKWLSSVTDAFDGMDIRVPVGLDLPNAASYLPRTAFGSVVPPRAGEYSGSNAQAESGSSLMATMKQALVEALSESGLAGGEAKADLIIDDIKFGQLVYKFGNKEKQRVGVRLVTGGA